MRYQNISHTPISISAHFTSPARWEEAPGFLASQYQESQA